LTLEQHRLAGGVGLVAAQAVQLGQEQLAPLDRVAAGPRVEALEARDGRGAPGVLGERGRTGGQEGDQEEQGTFARPSGHGKRLP
jgi:hypothetical protein